MSDLSQHAPSMRARSSFASFPANMFGALAFVSDFGAIIVTSIATGMLYHSAAYGDVGPLSLFWEAGLLVGFFYTLPFLFREKYSLTSFISNDEPLLGRFFVWNYAFFSMFAVGFLTKSTDIFSRGTVVLFYFAGFIAVALLRHLLVGAVKTGCKSGRIAARRIMLVGTKARIKEFLESYQPCNHGLFLTHSIHLDEHFEQNGNGAELQSLLKGALVLTRQERTDDVILLLPWSRSSLIEQCVEYFAKSSVSIHLGPPAIFSRFHDTKLGKLGGIDTLNLVRPPLSHMETGLKRAFDICASFAGLLALLPLFSVIMLAIRLDSKGPALFTQTRYGFNQKPFEILKFRTMTVMENGNDVRQVIENDPRITRMGRFMRKWNIDELPQLINVLKGDMSLVGPRPHAVAHDKEFTKKISDYARRMNVQPGITGFAQVNGFRGPTDTDEKIKTRVEHDLHYIDNWSFWLDMQILFLTLFSKKAYSNAH